MKESILLAILMTTSVTAMAQGVPKVCYKKSEQAVAKQAEAGYYDENGFETQECTVASNNAAIICEVSASKGDDAASDTFRVVLNKTCSKVFRVELTSEE